MTDHNPLSSNAIESALSDLPGWSYSDAKLNKAFEFSSFREAISFIVRLAFEAETLGHHPELRNVYNKVDVAITTHDAGNQVTEKDLTLARAIERFSWT